MLRLVTALLISLILHALLLANLLLPISEMQEWSPTRVHLADAEVAETTPEQPRQEPEIHPPAEMSQIPPVAPAGEPDESSSDEVSAEVQPDNGDGQSEMVPAETGEGDAPDIVTGLVDEVDTTGSGESEEPNGASNNAADQTVGGAGEVSEVDTEAILTEYRIAVLAAIDAQKIYPPVARRLGQEGDVRVRFQVSRGGDVSSVEIETSSGVTSLDEAAREAVISASPVPPIPPELEQDSLTLSLLIIFSLD